MRLPGVQAGRQSIDIQRQSTHRDREGEYAGMSTVALSARHPSEAAYVALWGQAGPGPAPNSEPAFGDEWMGDAETWCAAAEATPVLGATLRAHSVDWSFWQSDL